MKEAASIPTNGSAAEAARKFVLARRQGGCLRRFPGLYPSNLEEAYAIQRAAIDLWSEPVAGWKVGRLSPSLVRHFGVDRFVGPIFRSAVSAVDAAQEADFPVFVGGSAAFEAELIAYLGESLSPKAGLFSTREARDLVARTCLGIEIAGSPLAIMPDLDSLASIADLGNNNGALIGPQVPSSLLDEPANLACTTTIDGAVKGGSNAAQLPGGPLAAVAFCLEAVTGMGFPLEAGQFISTGAITGVHWIEVGQRCSADFGQWGRIDCLAVPFRRMTIPVGDRSVR